jgi:hypothetical protein
MKTYREYIKSLPCAVCAQDNSDQHHLIDIEGVTKGLGTRLPEMLSIPLCRMHHDNLHADLKEFELWYGKQETLLVKTLLRAMIDGWEWDHD